MGKRPAFAIDSVFIATQMARIYWPVAKSQGVVLSAPFRGEWLVIHGGFSPLINNHYPLACQRDALDMQRIADGHVQLATDKSLASCASWSQTIYAPAAGTVTETVNDLDDNQIGESDTDNLAGNHVVIDIGSGHYVWMAHLQKGSVRVHPGDAVRLGQPIARCGNSGNTSGPHLHLQVQNQPKFQVSDVRTYPILFQNVTCWRGGRGAGSPPFFVRRNDRIVAPE